LTKTGTDWSPETYGRFRGLRLRPALDLLAQVRDVPAGAVVDLGCGAGAVGPALAARFPGRDLVGVDLSPAMLDEARALGCYARLDRADLADWQAEATPALIFSNAALHWVSGHDRLLPRLARMLVPGGVLAVQMPAQYGAPSHALLRDLASALFPDRFDFTDWHPPVAAAREYAVLLAPFGAVEAWETEYVQTLASVASGHPVRHFTESTAMRPFVARMTAAEASHFVASYDAALSAPYPPQPDGSVLFPFRRVFMVLTCPS